MSHSRIFCISAEDGKVSYPDEGEMYELCQSFADYVDEVSNEKGIADSVDWLKCCAGDALQWIDSSSFRVVHPELVLEPRYQEFQQTLRKLGETTPEEFCKYNYELSYRIYHLKSAYSCEYEFHFYSDDKSENINGIYTYSDFLRQANHEKVYRIIGVYDYHC